MERKIRESPLKKTGNLRFLPNLLFSFGHDKKEKTLCSIEIVCHIFPDKFGYVVMYMKHEEIVYLKNSNHSIEGKSARLVDATNLVLNQQIRPIGVRLNLLVRGKPKIVLALGFRIFRIGKLPIKPLDATLLHSTSKGKQAKTTITHNLNRSFVIEESKQRYG